jgi:hypothetical protein
MMPNTLDRFRPLMNFGADRNFIYITACVDENKEDLRSYYNLTEEDLDEITKEWPSMFLILVAKEELSNPNLIGSLVVTCEEYNAPNNSIRKNKEDVRELSSASQENPSDSPGGGGGDEVDKEEKEEKEGEEYKQEQGEVTPPQNPLDDIDPLKKRKVSPMKPTSQK